MYVTPVNAGFFSEILPAVVFIASKKLIFWYFFVSKSLGKTCLHFLPLRKAFEVTFHVGKVSTYFWALSVSVHRLCTSIDITKLECNNQFYQMLWFGGLLLNKKPRKSRFIFACFNVWSLLFIFPSEKRLSISIIWHAGLFYLSYSGNLPAMLCKIFAWPFCAFLE